MARSSPSHTHPTPGILRNPGCDLTHTPKALPPSLSKVGTPNLEPEVPPFSLSRRRTGTPPSPNQQHVRLPQCPHHVLVLRLRAWEGKGLDV